MNINFLEFAENTADLTFSDIKNAVSKVDIINMPKEDLYKIVELLNRDTRKNVQKLSESILKKSAAHDNEVSRVRALYNFDKSYGNYDIVAGVDEVGRGPLAGPIVAAAVVLDLKTLEDSELILGINDSKKLSPKTREEIAEYIKEKALDWSIFGMNSDEIDRKGISYCNNNIFIGACNSLRLTPQLVLTDGYPIKNFNVRNQYIIKGDAKSASIACASIIAKVYRDSLMEEYSSLYPQYGFDKNAGYGTKEHIDAIKSYGITPIHRKSFLTGILGE